MGNAKRLPKKRKWTRAKAEQMRCLRLGELRHLARFLYGRALPDDDAGREHLAELLLVTKDEQMGAEQRHWAPWLPKAEASELISYAQSLEPRERWTPQKKLGQEMRVTNEMRTRLKLHSLFPCDMTEDEMEAFRKERKLEKQRRRLNQESREAYLASQAGSARRLKPWIPLRISQSQFYARKAKAVAEGKVVAMTPGKKPVLKKRDRAQSSKTGAGQRTSSNRPERVNADKYYYTRRSPTPVEPAEPPKGYQDSAVAALCRITEDTEPGMV